MKIKKLLFTTLFSAFAGLSVQAQATERTEPTPAAPEAAWEKPAAICDPYQAEKDAEASMKPAVKAVYNAFQTPEDKTVNAARNIICNPPKKSNKTD